MRIGGLDEALGIAVFTAALLLGAGDVSGADSAQSGQPAEETPELDPAVTEARQTQPADSPEAGMGEALRRVQEPFKELQPSEDTRQDHDDADLCDPNYSEPYWQEDTQEFFRGVSCHTFRWIDGLFGDEIDYPEESVNGLVTVGGSWNEYEGFDSRLRFRVRVPLPNWDNRWSLLFDRGDDNAIISDTDTQSATFYNPGLINRQSDDSLLLGLGGRPRDGSRGWDWSVGAKLRSTPVLYVRSRWNYYRAYSPETDLRFRQTFFWRNDDGFGATARADLTHALNEQDVVRLESVVTYAEESAGAEWYIGHTWYHLMRDRRAFSLLTFATGESDGPVSMRNAGFNFIWRQNLTRDWIWISYGPSITWPRFEPEDKRELTLGFGVWVEMEFGNWSY